MPHYLAQLLLWTSEDLLHLHVQQCDNHIDDSPILNRIGPWSPVEQLSVSAAFPWLSLLLPISTEAQPYHPVSLLLETER